MKTSHIILSVSIVILLIAGVLVGGTYDAIKNIFSKEEKISLPSFSNNYDISPSEIKEVVNNDKT